jgi:hypothetical protein
MTHLSTARIAADPNAIGTCCGLPSTAGARLIATAAVVTDRAGMVLDDRSTRTRWPGCSPRATDSALLRSGSGSADEFPRL